MLEGTTPAMTIREYFAAIAMQAYISANGDNFEDIDKEVTAKFSVEMADALIRELQTEKEAIC